MSNVKKNNRITLVILAILFATPVLLAMLMHSQWWQYRPGATRNIGELMQPPVAIEGWPDTSSDLAIDAQTPIWTLLVASDSDCNNSCQEQLTWLRQIRLAQGRHADQVNIQLSTSDQLPVNQQTAVTGISDIIYIANNIERNRLQQAIDQLATPATTSGITTYLIDPAGFIILRYPQSSEPGGIRKDLGRLLTWSNKARKD